MSACCTEALESRWLLSAAVTGSEVVDRAALERGTLKSNPSKGVVARPGNASVIDAGFTPVPVSTQQQVVPKGGAIPEISPAAQSSLTIVQNLTNPHGLTTDESGNLWLSAQGASTPSNVLYEYSSTGTLLSSYTVDSTSNAQPGAVAVVPVTSSGNSLTENTILWEKTGGAVSAFNPATQTQKLLFTADSLTVDLSSVYDPNRGGSYNFSGSITPSTAVYQNGLNFYHTSTYDDFFLSGVSNNVPFVLRVREESGSIVSAKVIAASLDAPAGAAYSSGVGVSTAGGYIVTLLNYGTNGPTVPFLFTDNYPEGGTSSTEVTYTNTDVTGYAITTDYEANAVIAVANPVTGTGQIAYVELDPFGGAVTNFTTSFPSASTSDGIAFNPATNTVDQDYIFNNVSSGYGEIWNEPLASVFSGYTPSQLKSYYGLNQVSYPNGTAANGAGQTIAIIDFGDDPNLSLELSTFDAAMGLAAPPSLTQLSQTGTTTLPSESSETAEESLDVEWSHAMAPGAKIVVFETRNSSTTNIKTAINTARAYTGVSVISMSFGGAESSGDISDSTFTTPSGHTGVTFVASSGDGGSYPGNPGTISGGTIVNSPASSSNVLAVGGTTLNYNTTTGDPVSEVAWGTNNGDGTFSGSGGGISKIEAEPSWQTPVAGSLSGRGVPDVSFLADPDTGVKQYDMQAGGWFIDGGTSLSAPCWAGIIAIINQGRTIHGQPVLNASTDLTSPAIYGLSTADFTDITSGSNGTYSAGPGYDEVTGRGTPIANKLIPDMEAAYVTVSGVTLPSASQYIRLDPDGSDVDIYNNTTGTGTPAEFYLLSTVSSLSLTGPTTGLAVTVDWSNGAPLPAAGLTFTGQGSATTNTLTIIGTPSGSDTVASSSSQISVNSVPVNFSDVGTVNFSEGTGTDTLSVTSGKLTLLIGGHVDYFSSIGVGVSTTLAVAPPASHAARLLIDTATLTLAGTINNWSATLDLDGSDLAVTGGSLPTISNQIASGFANGKWNGTGITDSVAAGDTTHLTALGSILNTADGSTPLYSSGYPLGTFDTTSPGIAAILVKNTYLGDANLDGKVDASDYSRIDSGYLQSITAVTTGWYNGDFNYDSVINGTDYTLIDNAFNRQGATLAAEVAPDSTAAAHLGTKPAAVALVAANESSSGLASSDFFSNTLIRHKHPRAVNLIFQA